CSENTTNEILFVRDKLSISFQWRLPDSLVPIINEQYPKKGCYEVQNDILPAPIGNEFPDISLSQIRIGLSAELADSSYIDFQSNKLFRIPVIGSRYWDDVYFALKSDPTKIILQKSGEIFVDATKSEVSMELVLKGYFDSNISWTWKLFIIQQLYIKPSGCDFEKFLGTYDEETISNFYQQIIPTYTFDYSEDDIQPKALLVNLYKYQKNAVGWMLMREGVGLNDNFQICNLYERPVIDLGYHFRNKIDEEFYFNPLNGEVSKSNIFTSVSDFSGGILADEMGMGKTIELLALILMHNQTHSGPTIEYSSDLKQKKKKLKSDKPDMSTKSELIPTKATLIVVPGIILGQWCSEIEKHAPSLNVFIYARKREEETIENFNDYDIVCIDEAQRVETSNKLTDFAKCIPRIHTWAVTSTPIGKYGFTDLWSLFDFLGVKPSEDLSAVNFVKCFSGVEEQPIHGSEPTSKILQIVKTYMHRNTKLNTRNEVILPEQHHHIVKVQFSSVERHFYNKLVERYSELIEIGKIAILNDEDAAEELKRVMSIKRIWFHRLRQTCAHIQLGGHNQNILGKSFRNLDEVLEKMVTLSKIKVLVLSLNLWGCNISKAKNLEKNEKWDSALEIYIQILENVEKTLGSLQSELQLQNHIMSNSNLTDADFENELENEAKINHKPEQSIATYINNFRFLQHRIVFHIAGVHHIMKNETEENLMYVKAEDIRRQILHIWKSKVLGNIEKFRIAHNLRTIALTKGGKLAMEAQLQSTLGNISLKEIDHIFSLKTSELKTNVGGMYIENYLNLNNREIESLCNDLNEQWDMLNEWRSKLAQILMYNIEISEE
ncbi:hypothetical protein HK096_003358, partial [Nowakowskiella sp. JEL0078]